MSVRPVHRMIAHSAFIIIARRLADTADANAFKPAVDDDDETEEPIAT
jgi:hypothetical protein